MSLILEALRKSEAQRRRGQAPDLFAETSTVARHAAAPSPRWLWWMLAAIAALLLTGWFARGLWNTPLQRAGTAPAPVLADAAPHKQNPSNDVAPAAAGADALPRAIVAAPAPVTTAATAAVASPVPAAPLPTLPIEPLPSAVKARPANIGPPPGNVATIAPVSAPTMPPASVPAPAAPPAATSDAPLRLADLSSEERRQLPALKMSMHLWHSASAQRFVILDGERMGEGDRIGDAVIEEITRDGVLLAWQGRRLLVPIQ